MSYTPAHTAWPHLTEPAQDLVAQIRKYLDIVEPVLCDERHIHPSSPHYNALELTARHAHALWSALEMLQERRPLAPPDSIGATNQ